MKINPEMITIHGVMISLAQLSFFAISNSARSDRFIIGLQLFAFVGIRYLVATPTPKARVGIDRNLLVVYIFIFVPSGPPWD